MGPPSIPPDHHLAEPCLGTALGADPSRQLEAVFEAMTDGVWICDATPRLLWINQACERLNEIRRSDVCGRPVRELLGSGNFDHDATSRVLRTGRPVAINQKVVSGRTLLVNAVPVFGDDGAIAYVVGTERDLTELNLLREELGQSQQMTRKMSAELRALRMKDADLGHVVAESESMERVLDTALKVADFDTTVLLTGPSGTGKTLIAKVIHDGSLRASGSFMSLNCGAIPESLIEAELFGYAQGAFTGAQKGGKSGLIEAANGGTLFLDEIDAFPPQLQVKLLTFLDTQSFIRVGETQVKSVDVRLIAATNKDLACLVDEGSFREDLWFRLNVVPLAIPALRDRPADIPALVQAALERLNERYGKDRTIAPDALDLLCRHDYPGNVRELQNLLERVYVLAEGSEIRPADLPAAVRGSASLSSTAGPGSLPERLAALEAELVAEASQRHHRQVDLARELGVSQATVNRLLKKHHLRIGERSFMHQ